jgi:hypothetical protein
MTLETLAARCGDSNRQHHQQSDFHTNDRDSRLKQRGRDRVRAAIISRRFIFMRATLLTEFLKFLEKPLLLFLKLILDDYII